MNDYLLIDLDDTITKHNYNNRIENIMISWLKFNNVETPEIVYHNHAFNNRNTRLKLLNLSYDQYKEWYKNFSDVEFNFYINKFKNSEIEIPIETLNFIKTCKIPLILVSNSSPKWIDFILNQYNIKIFFKYVFKRDYEIDDVKKPNKKILKIIEKDIQDKISKNSIVIGDSEVDLQFAKHCNLMFCGVYNKFGKNKSFDNFTSLSKYINNLKVFKWTGLKRENYNIASSQLCVYESNSRKNRR